jgi:hypothetical protein
LNFANQCDEALALSVGSINDLAESQLIAAIKDKNTTAITFWLKHRHKSYATTSNISGEVHHDGEILTKEQEQVLDQALRMAGLAKPKGNDNEKVNE